MARYTFGDSDLAAARLALVASVFEAPSRDLLQRSIPPGSEVLDVGCGPGHSTRLVAETCRPRRLVGLDASAAYVELARRTTTDPVVAFEVHDVTAPPLPGAPVDALYGRLLLAHLPDPLAIVERWATQVRPGGVVVLDELDDIEAPPGPLRAYEELVVRVVDAGGGAMYAGPLLAPLGGRSVGLPVDGAVAASMYAMNLASWREDAVAGGLAGDDELDDLALALAEVAERPGERTVRWVLHHAVLEV